MPVSKNRRKNRKKAGAGTRSAVPKGGGGVAPLLVVGALAAALGGATWVISGGLERDDGPKVSVTVPRLSEMAQNGQVVFNANCASCHGRNAAGGDKGPPLIHRIYESGHHGDGAFELAVLRGVRAHHWPFGDMPPQPGITPSQVRAIIAFIRETQNANGIN
jgi:mono/diheme cytochrome c family protein